MHDAILAQPACIDRMLGSQRDVIERAAAAAAAKKRIIFAGIGTSFNAARLGAFFLRWLSGGRALVAVEQSFEFIHYPLALGPDDAVVLSSHRGWKNFSVEALKRAKAAGALTIAITGELGGEGMGLADFRIATCEQENSFAHTKSFSTALTALALFAVRVAQHRNLLSSSGGVDPLREIENISSRIRGALSCEAACAAAAKEIATRPRLLFVGAGPQWTLASEASLKVKETSYFHTEGLETEEFLHGPFSEMDSRASLVALLVDDSTTAQPSPAYARLIQALRAVGELGVYRVAVVSRQNSTAPAAPPNIPAERVIELPGVPEWLSTFTHLIPIQFLSYYLALARGTNPDTGRQHEPAHARAQSLFKL
jgi:glucosamine--fructose-6-phosphate aminotransferase (isomerizing)